MGEWVSVAFSSPEGEELRFDWDVDRLARLDPAADDEPWRLAGELDWDEVEAARVLSGRLDDGRQLAIAAIRPRGAEGHGDEAVSGLLIERGRPEELDEVLLSTEYRDGEIGRVGLELYRDDAGLPIRVAGDATEAGVDERGGVRRERARLALRSGGVTGTGLYEVLRAG